MKNDIGQATAGWERHTSSSLLRRYGGAVGDAGQSTRQRKGARCTLVCSFFTFAGQNHLVMMRFVKKRSGISFFLSWFLITSGRAGQTRDTDQLEVEILYQRIERKALMGW